MCGFVGYCNTGFSESNNQRIIKEMADTIKHRGPDDESYYIDDSMVFGFRRLAIIDLEHGKQPMTDTITERVLQFNGEIYNYQEIRAFLEEKGYVFETESDTEVILRGYDYFGEKIVTQLRGMFAFVIWDKKANKLFGARDHFGIKPLYYYQADGEFVFGSEIKGLLPHPKLKKAFNETILADYLSMEYTTDQTTFFKDIYKVMPGHYFCYDLTNKEMSTTRYFDPVYPIQKQTREEETRKIEQAVEESVSAHLIADVEVGSFLSSGVDSSYILKTASEQQNIQSFSVGYEEEKFSELSYSTDFSDSIAVKNTSRKISADDFMNAIPNIQYHMDEPLSNPSAIPLYFVAQTASEKVKVVLSGEGADELFGGYNRYLDAIPYSKYDKTPRRIRVSLAKLAKKMPAMKGKRFLVRGALPIEERNFRIDYVFSFNERNQLLKNQQLNKDLHQETKKIFEKAPMKDEIHEMMYFDFHTWLPYDILLKADRMSMANSLELRVPFLDKEVMKVAATLPSKDLIQKNKTKVALRETANKKLAEHVANKPKLGFPSPLAEWIKREDIRADIQFAFHTDFAKTYFDQAYLDQLLEDHCAGKKANMRKIWSVYTLIVWYYQFFD
ncbi:asparagine synthase (glutamine-hydrolyzing) [Pisciglobus halotolerans]|uniref:asparagine synthase (glutamine-hydrolyzing) n=1 Tax=Pisciglobus halotolerans TaxID=745365 RepID=A0A1I3B5F5_9LACT|nr:asparagine synthase (glutamine-hydrolyzing) [Pisciglobus halotolerans]SFH57514.1 asparagine synthase (glutamine-hydrolysing) [Pisciglobus halotolerans]